MTFTFTKPVFLNPRPKGETPDVLILTTGTMAKECLEACEILGDLTVEVVHMPTVKPFHPPWSVTQCDKLVTVEEGTVGGGLGSALLECLNEIGQARQVIRIGVQEGTSMCTYGTRDDLMSRCGLTGPQIAERIMRG